MEFAETYLRNHGIETAREDMLKQLSFRFALKAGYAFIDGEGVRFTEPTEVDDRSIEELLAAWDAPVQDETGPRYRFALTGENTKSVDWLIENSRFSSIIFHALIQISASMARNGIPYKGQLQDWVADYLLGKINKTTRKGHIRAATLYRDLLIVGAINELTEAGLPPTRNDASPPTSACDAVAEACRKLDVSPRSFQSVKRIWNNSERVLRYF